MMATHLYDEKSPRILHVIDHLGLGGAQTIVKDIFQRQSRNPRIFLTALRARDVTVAIDHPNVQYASSSAKYSLAPLRRLRRKIIDARISVLHCHLFRSCMLGLLLKMRHFPDIRLIFHEQGRIMGSDTRSRCGSLWYRLFMRMAHRYVDSYIAVSEAIRQQLIAAGVPPKQIVTIPNFIDIEQFTVSDTLRHAARHELLPRGIGPDDVVFGLAGRLVSRKGWREFLEAAKAALHAGAPVKFLISGDGPDTSELCALIDHDALQRQVFFLGYTTDMLRFYACLDGYVMASHWEGLPLTQLEVMAAGVALITTDGPGLNEIPRKDTDALFVTVGDVRDLTDKILLLANNAALRKTLRNNARERVQTYNIGHVLTQLDHLYQECRSPSGRFGNRPETGADV